MTKNSSMSVARLTTNYIFKSLFQKFIALIYVYSPINDKTIKNDGFKFHIATLLTVPFFIILYIHMISIGLYACLHMAVSL